MSGKTRHLITETDRLILRAPSEADLDAMYEVYSDAETQRFNPMGAMTSREAASHMLWRWQLHWLRHGFGMWAICAKSDPSHVIGFGGVAWRDVDAGKQLIMHVHLRQSACGVGIATELGRAVLAWQEAEMPGVVLTASVAAEHGAAVRTLKKLGFVPAGQATSLPWMPAKALYHRSSSAVQAKATATYQVSLAGQSLLAKSTYQPSSRALCRVMV